MRWFWGGPCVVSQELARLLCAMLYKDGDDLTTLLVEAGILIAKSGGGHQLNRIVLKKCFVGHVVVSEGHWVTAYWPRGQAGDCRYRVCTCVHHALHAECEHVKFVGGLRGSPNLNNVPVIRARGRKRKQRR